MSRIPPIPRIVDATKKLRLLRERIAYLTARCDDRPARQVPYLRAEMAALRSALEAIEYVDAVWRARHEAKRETSDQESNPRANGSQARVDHNPLPPSDGSVTGEA